MIESIKTLDCNILPEKRGKDHEINVRSILAAFIIGTGGTDVVRMMTMLGLGGGVAFDTMFFKYQKEVCGSILKRSREIVRKALLDEITITLHETMKGNLSDEQLSVCETLIKNNELNELHGNLPSIGLIVSYDMG